MKTNILPTTTRLTTCVM